MCINLNENDCNFAKLKLKIFDGIFQIQDSKLRFRYNLNSLRTEEKEIWLSAIFVDDGQWHTVKVSRYGSAAILTLDGGEGRRYNDSFIFKGHQMMTVDKQEGVYAGGKGNSI